MDTGILGSRVWAFKPRGIRLVVEGLYLLGGGGPGVEGFRVLRVYDRSTSRTVALSLSLSLSLCARACGVGGSKIH